LGGEEEPEPEIVELQTKTALVFIVTSSLVLLFLFYFRSIWSAWLLVFLFCVGGLQVPAQPGRKRLCLILYGFISFCSCYVAQLFSGIALCCLDSHYKVWPLAEHTKSNPLHCRTSDLNTVLTVAKLR
jgi:hypothetical protein